MVPTPQAHPCGFETSFRCSARSRRARAVVAPASAGKMAVNPPAMDTATLRHILLEELEGYTGEALNEFAYLTTNGTEQIYTIVDIATVRDKRLVGTVLVARLANDQVVIELDRCDNFLADALKARGILLSWTAPSDDIDGCQCLRRRPRRGRGESQLLILSMRTSDIEV